MKPLGNAKGLFFSMRSIFIIVLTALFAGVLVVVIYWPGLHGAFFFDDGPSILVPEGVRLETLTLESIRQALISGDSGPSGRPVAQLSFALNHYFGGFEPYAFKATNLAIHLVCGLLVFGLAHRLLAATKPAAERRHILRASGAVAVLWLLHPIQLLPILHAVQRMTSLAALFLLAALLLHVGGRERGGRTGTLSLVLAWGVLWPMSFFSKETGVLFPLLALAWELILRRSAHGKIDGFARNFTVLTSLIFAAGTAYAFSPFSHWLWAGYDIRSFSLVERLLTEGRVLWFYLGLIAVPRLEALGLYHDDIAVSTGLLSPWTTFAAMSGLIVLAWLAWRMRIRAPLVTFGIVWFLIGHALESTVLPLEIAHEHRNYLPIFGILLAGGWALIHALESTGPRKNLGVALVSIMLVYFPLVTALRAHQFGDEGRRTQIEAQHHQLSARAQFEAGAWLEGLPDAAFPKSPVYALARRHYESANNLNPDSKNGLLGLIELDCKAGLPVERVEIGELSRRLRETPFAPADRNILYNLKEKSINGTICLARPDMQTLFSAAFANSTVSITVLAMLYSWYADYLMLKEKDLEAAKAALAKSLQLVFSNPSNRLKWAQLVLLEGRREEAVQLLKALQGERLSTSEKKTVANLLACLEGDSVRCDKI